VAQDGLFAYSNVSLDSTVSLDKKTPPAASADLNIGRSTQKIPSGFDKVDLEAKKPPAATDADTEGVLRAGAGVDTEGVPRVGAEADTEGMPRAGMEADTEGVPRAAEATGASRAEADTEGMPRAAAAGLGLYSSEATVSAAATPPLASATLHASATIAGMGFATIACVSFSLEDDQVTHYLFSLSLSIYIHIYI